LPLTDYEIVIGLEVHAELKTESKAFCGCSTEFGGRPNSRVCPVCLGLPGSLPVLNRKALEYAILAGLALNCRIAEHSRFDRKQYFYPDLPKAYQISQLDLPICSCGFIDIPADEELGGGTRRVGITRVHLEEEAGKLVHSGSGILDSEYSLADYNRGGIPLIEIVSEPDIRSPLEAKRYLEQLKLLLQYTGVSDCKMEEGSLRCDANISLRLKGESRLGVRCEIKNMNSFKAVEAALQLEAERQAELLDSGEPVVSQTRAWDEATGTTVFMRTKETSSDYRYFPDPDLAPIVVSVEMVEEIRRRLPEMPEEKQQRYVNELRIPEYDASLICGSKELADYFDSVVAVYEGSPKTVSNWVMGELLRLINQEKSEVASVRISPVQFAALLRLVDKGVISGTIAKGVFEEMFATGEDPDRIVARKGLTQISDADELGSVVDGVLSANSEVVESIKSGNQKAVGFLVGQVMKETQGKANPQIVNKLLRERLGL
jgi:aspartyl-tRNA(Asn)/glutamyl-tRNA(Gln) amidotransferase subunit B